MNRYAEEANYWKTTVTPAKSQGEIMQLLEDFGAVNFAVMQGQAQDKLAWMVLFEWQDHSYRFAFTPLTCKQPNKVASFGGKRRSHTEQARYQMGRGAVHFVKAVLVAAEMNPAALFGFMELPETATPHGIPRTAAELDVSGVMSALPALPG